MKYGYKKETKMKVGVYYRYKKTSYTPYSERERTGVKLRDYDGIEYRYIELERGLMILQQTIEN